MGDASSAFGADERTHAALRAALERLGLTPEEVPEGVLGRMRQRAKHPDQRLVVGRYLVLGELGRGGMGVVYDAWDPGIERRVAIKTIEPDLVPEEEREEVVERFRRETKIVGRLHHPTIVTIYDSGSERAQDATGRWSPSLFYYVMEYLEGQSLARVLREKRTLPDQDAVRIAADIAEALQLSHDAGVIHRDIKPSNIYLRNGVEAVLLDFGIAKTGSVALTRQGQILGTPSYLAPERLKEKEVAIDGRADIFSLGVLLFTMLTGEAPFVGDDVYEVIDKIAKESHPKLARSTPSGQALSRVIDRMLAKKPQDRYASAVEAAKALREVLALLKGPSSPVVDWAEEVSSPALPPGRPGPAAPSTYDNPEEDTGKVLRASSSSNGTLDDSGRPARNDSVPAPETELLETLGGPESGFAARPMIEDSATEIGKADDPLRVAEVLGTRPELALMRETRELKAKAEPVPHPHVSGYAEDTAPAVPTASGPKVADFSQSDATPSEEDYQPHGVHNDEVTDDETVADSGAKVRVPSALRRPVKRAHVDERATEQVVRAKPATGSSAPIPAPSTSEVDRAAGSRGKRSRIEASLVDEEEVVVKPAPLGVLKPDELPTQTGYKVQSQSSAAAVSSVLMPPPSYSTDVVRARGDSRVQDPAELAQEVPRRPQVAAAPATRSPPPKEPKDEGDDSPRSAAVARKTFGPAGAPATGSGPRPRTVQVRVSGKPLNNSPEERLRLIRRRAMMLLVAGLASVAIGLLLGRMRTQGETVEIAVEGEAPSSESPKVQPRAVRPIPGTDELAVVRPRSPQELISDAEAARTAGQPNESARLFESASRALAPDNPLMPKALLGLADMLRQLGENREAIRIYQQIVREHGRGLEADQARIALEALGVPVARPAPPRPKVGEEKAAGTEAPTPTEAPPPATAPRLDPNMSPDEKCATILLQYNRQPEQAVRAFEALESEHPRAECVFWNLGRKHESLGDTQAALGAYRRLLTVAPTSQRRQAVEQKIADLEAKQRQ